MDSPRVGSEVDLDYRRIESETRGRGGDIWGWLIARIKKLNPLFWLTVVIPTALAILYFGLLASDVYVPK